MLDRIPLVSKNFFSIDASKVLCVKSDCNFIDPINNRMIYTDGNHLSQYGASLIVDEIEKFLEKKNLIISNTSQRQG